MLDSTLHCLFTMSKKNKDKDLISEEEFNLQMGSSATLPEEDSPGDSESDSGTELKWV